MSKFLLGFLLILPVFAQHHNRPAKHGMLLFGQTKTYFSHLPLFSAAGRIHRRPGNVQLAAAVEIRIVTILYRKTFDPAESFRRH